MGMLYYECKKCNRTIGIFGKYVGFIKCESCKEWIHEDKDPKFQKYIVKCPTCEFTVSFQAMGSIYTRCVKCDVVPKEIPTIRKVQHELF